MANRQEPNCYRLVVFDLDGTLIKPLSSWRYLHQALGTWQRAKVNTDLFYGGMITWREWAERDAKLWTGTQVYRIEEIVEQCPRTEGAVETLDRLHEEGIATSIVSGGISFFAERIAHELKIDAVFANRLQQRDGILTGQVVVTVDQTNKAEICTRLGEGLGISMKKIVAVGDDFTMIPVFKTVGLSIAFNPIDLRVEKSATVSLKCKDLTTILPFVFKQTS